MPKDKGAHMASAAGECIDHARAAPVDERRKACASARVFITMTCLGRIGLVAAATGLALVAAEARAREEGVKTSVFARAHHGYHRTTLPDGNVKIETYALADGGASNPGLADRSLDGLSFEQIARVLLKPLADRHYAPSSDPEKTDLLIIVSYGRTVGTGDAGDSPAHHDFYSQMQTLSDEQREGGSLQKTGRHPLDSLLTRIGMENQQRDRADQRNAQLLGYQDELARTDTIAQYSAGGIYRGDLIADVEEDRYFVILVACDFRAATKEKKIRPLWSMRFNTAARGRDFVKTLPVMASLASRYFGEDSNGLLREDVPAGKIELHDIVTLGDDQKSK